LITIAEADVSCEQGEYKHAAELYARSSKPFEHVALTFMDHTEPDALRLYLTKKLDHLTRSVPSCEIGEVTIGCDSTDHDIDVGD